MVTSVFLLRSKPSVFLAVSSPSLESRVKPLMVVDSELRMLKDDFAHAEEHGAGDGRALLPVPGALAIQSTRAADGQLGAREEDERTRPFLKRINAQPGSLDVEPSNTASRYELTFSPNVVVPEKTTLAPDLRSLRSSVTPAGTVSELMVTVLHEETSAPLV